MRQRVEFEVVCPNNHNQSVAFSREEFDAAIDSGGLVFHCNTCDTDWNPSREDIAKMRKQLPEDAN